MNHIIIEGFIGSGKGAVAKIVASRLGISRVDVDRCVAQKLKMTNGEIYDRFGEPYYRAMETLVLDELTGISTRHVIILGSGVAMMPQNASYLKSLGRVYYIRMRQSTLLERIRDDQRHAWLRGEEKDDKIARLYKEREPAYRKTADVIIPAEGKSVEEIAEAIIEDIQNEEE